MAILLLFLLGQTTRSALEQCAIPPASGCDGDNAEPRCYGQREAVRVVTALRAMRLREVVTITAWNRSTATPLASAFANGTATAASCALVGSSPTLLRSKDLGARIDSHDLVVRFNFAPTSGRYGAFVGRRTDARLMAYSWVELRAREKGTIIIHGPSDIELDLRANHGFNLLSVSSAVDTGLGAGLKFPVSGGMRGVLLCLRLCGSLSLFGYDLDGNAGGHYYDDEVRDQSGYHSNAVRYHLLQYPRIHCLYDTVPIPSPRVIPARPLAIDARAAACSRCQPCARVAGGRRRCRAAHLRIPLTNLPPRAPRFHAPHVRYLSPSTIYQVEGIVPSQLTLAAAEPERLEHAPATLGFGLRHPMSIKLVQGADGRRVPRLHQKGGVVRGNLNNYVRRSYTPEAHTMRRRHNFEWERLVLRALARAGCVRAHAWSTQPPTSSQAAAEAQQARNVLAFIKAIAEGTAWNRETTAAARGLRDQSLSQTVSR
jgi:hypothetical protein